MIIGGPNGAGKTTLSVRMTAAWELTYLGADQIAAEQGLGSTGQDAIRAARLFSFRKVGYDISVVLVFVDSPEVCIARIRERVARGGHFVPDDDVRRRFGRSLRNFWQTYRLQAHRWLLHYNGSEGLTEAARGGECAMKTSSTAREPRLSKETVRLLDEMTRISKQAVREAREENRRLGIPNVQLDEQGRLTEELPDGTVRLIQPK